MKARFRNFMVATLAVAMLLMPAMGMAQQSYYYNWQVVDERGEPFTGQNVQCSVYRPNQHAAAILHTTSNLSSGGNSPLFSDANGKLHFYSSQSDPVDVVCSYANGGAAQINKFRVTDHKIVIPRQASSKIVRFSVNNVTTATNQSAGITIPAGALIREVIIQNLNPKGGGTTYHLSVGFAGNHAVAANVNALVSAQALNSPDEWLRPHLVLAVGAPTAIAAGNHRGAALSVYHASGCGGGDAACGGNNGTGTDIYRERPYLVHVATGLDVTYAVAVPGLSGGARLHVFIEWTQFHTGINRLGLTN